MSEIDNLIREIENFNPSSGLPADFIDRLRSLPPDELLAKMEELGMYHISRSDYEKQKKADEIKVEIRQRKIDEIKEDLRIVLDIVREMTGEYKTLEPITWPATLMLLFNEIRQTRIDYTWPQIGGIAGEEIGEDSAP